MKQHRTSGFTLLEMMVVIALLVVVTTFAVPGFRKLYKDFRINEILDHVDTFFKGYRGYYLVNNEYHVKFGIRPEDIVKGDKFKSVISLSELLGSEYFIHLKIDNIELVSKVDAKSKFLVGDNFSFDFTKTIHLFSNITGNRII